MMPIFSDIADQWQTADDAFGAIEWAALAADDGNAFDTAGEQRKRNDQAYFLYMFTRFEDAVNRAATTVLSNRTTTGIAWSDRRIWDAWARRGVEDIHFMSKVEVLVDKSRAEYASVKSYYDGRNDVAHGGIWARQFVIPSIAAEMEALVIAFPQS
jgi:hypothetical protein